MVFNSKLCSKRRFHTIYPVMCKCLFLMQKSFKTIKRGIIFENSFKASSNSCNFLNKKIIWKWFSFLNSACIDLSIHYPSICKCKNQSKQQRIISANNFNKLSPDMGKKPASQFSSQGFMFFFKAAFVIFTKTLD